MELFKGTPVCSLGHHCSQWAQIYLKYCLCSTKDGVALILGTASIISWGVAEVPQIITNYKEKSTEGISVAFLMTWIIGDLFNVMGCLLEPATLPTQFFMALLYTATTVVLASQTIYYRHLYHYLKLKRIGLLQQSHKLHEEDTSTSKKLLYSIDEKESKINISQGNGSCPGKSLHVPSTPISVSAPISHLSGSSGRDLYYMSARSLSKSPMPTVGSWSAYSRESARTPPFIHDQHSSRESLLGSLVPMKSEPSLNTKNMLCVVSSGAFFLYICVFRLSVNHPFSVLPNGVIINVGRRLLQEKMADTSVGHGDGSSIIGTFLGWSMAAIYMGGRLPQIYLNIRRGHVEGLSPLMFIFALIGNATYVGSILVNSLDWSKIRPNLPWLVDAGGCVLLDAFILIQFVYFRYWKPKDVESRDGR